LKENIGVRNIVLNTLEIFLKIAGGATQSKITLRSFNALSTFTDIITHYTTDPEVRNLASACTAEVFKVTQLDDEDSNETWSSSSSSDEESSNQDQMDSIESSFQTLKRAVENEHYELLQKENIKQSEMIKQLQAELEQEQLARKATEDELELVKYYREYESSIVEEKELENQHIRDEYDQLQKNNLELITQNETYQKELEQLESSFDGKTAEIQKSEQTLLEEQIDLLRTELTQKHQQYQQLTENLKDTQQSNQKLQSILQEKNESIEESVQSIEKLKLDKLELTERIAYLSKEKLVMENKLEDSVEDSMLFYWMTVAIRLDQLMHDSRNVVFNNFDRQEVYESLKQNQVPYTA
jgi:chromosome segregation ATPase